MPSETMANKGGCPGTPRSPLGDARFSGIKEDRVGRASRIDAELWMSEPGLIDGRGWSAAERSVVRKTGLGASLSFGQ
jgi:hypothetical protein